jgi:hypothetical protein
MLKVIDPATLHIIFHKLLLGKMATIELLQKEEECRVTRIFNNLDVIENDVYYKFQEDHEEYISFEILKDKINTFEFNLDTIILHMTQQKVIISIENMSMDDISDYAC